MSEAREEKQAQLMAKMEAEAAQRAEERDREQEEREEMFAADLASQEYETSVKVLRP